MFSIKGSNRKHKGVLADSNAITQTDSINKQIRKKIKIIDSLIQMKLILGSKK